MNHHILQVDSVSSATKVAEFLKSVWKDGGEVVPLDLILASQHLGGYCAFIEVDGDIQAASFGFRGNFQGEDVLHSHVTASNISGLGYQLKLHQRNWAKEQKIEAITWTFDPLVRRNAVFNFSKLGAVALEYLPNFYGNMTDSINSGDQSDRLLAYWSVIEQPFTPKVTGESTWVELPVDIEKLRQTNLETATNWRSRVRSQLMPMFETGAVIRTMNPERTALLVEGITK